MRDRSKQLLVINTGKKQSEQTGMPSQSGTTHIIGGGGLSVNMSDYLLKSIWDKVFEVRTDSQGIEYIFGKLPLVTQYGITMYAGDGVDIPSLASGLPFDGRTIWYNPETNQIEVIGGTGGGSGEGVSNFWDLSGIPSWITNSKPKYTYSEIEGTPDLTKYALASQIPSLSGYATESWVAKQNYATKATTLIGYGITDAYTKTNVDDLLKSYVTLGGTQTITGEKNFVGGLKVNGSPIYYDTEKKYWKLEGDLLVTGGVTMYGSDSSFTPSTIMDAILYDDATLGINSNGQLYVKGGTSGGGLDITALQNYLTQNSYLNVAEGDGRYLKLSGGTISNNGYALILNRESENPVWIQFRIQNEFVGAIGGENGALRFMDKNSIVNTVWHSGNFNPSNYLPLSGGTINVESGTIFNATFGKDIFGYNPSYGVYIGSTYNEGNSYWLYSGCHDNPNPLFFKNGEFCTLWHSGNDGSGSTLDADLLDGNHLSDILASNVASATKLQTARTIWGQSFDGTGNVSGALSDVTGITFKNDYYGLAIDEFGNFSFKKPYSTAAVDWSFKDSSGNKLMIINNNGNVGIGTASPAYKLDVNGEFRCVSAIRIQPHAEGWADAFFNYSSTKGYLLSARGGEANKNFRLYNYTDSSYNALIDITEYGNVGIGTTNPIAKLDVAGGISCDAVLCQWNNSTSFSVPNMLNPGYAWYGSAKSHLYPNNGTQATMCWKSVLSNGYETAYSIGTFHPTNSYGYMILTVGHGTTRDCFLEIQSSGVVSVSGNFLAQGGITMYSDQRKKTILNHVELSLKQIAEAPLIEHYYNSDDKKITHVGSIAQYWASMNDWFCKLDSEGFYTMEIQNAALASAISIARELDRYETKTDKAIKKLKNRIYELEEEVERLKSA